ncbi:MAG: type II secretion system F family protein [Candidatus Nanohaloarchaea archaeon]
MNRSIIKGIFELNPEIFKERIEEEAMYADIENYENTSLSMSALGIFVSLVIAFLIPVELIIQSGIFIGLSIIAYFFTPYILISLLAERRKKEMERVLPDALLLISTNLKSGTSINRAFLISARDEFGPLADELRKTAIQISGGKSVTESLDAMRGRVKSELFGDTLKVLSDALESGGNTTDLLDSSAEDIRNSLELRQEIQSSIRMYVMFILMAAVVGAPILFSITVYMSQTTTQMWEQTNINQANQFVSGGSQGLSFSKPQVNTDFLIFFSISALIISNSFAGLIISQIKNGNIKEGAKYIPITVTISVALFLAVKTGITSALG